jgi:hypothetical protein
MAFSLTDAYELALAVNACLIDADPRNYSIAAVEGRIYGR